MSEDGKIIFPFYAVVLKHEMRTTKTGRYFWRNELRTAYGDMISNIWNAKTYSVEKYPKTKDILEITAIKDEREDKGSITLDGYHIITKEQLPDAYKDIAEPPRASKADMDAAWAIIKDDRFWNKKANYNFTMDCLSRVDERKLNLLPAGIRVHHSFLGGLIIHTSEVASLTRGMTPIVTAKYKFFDSDVCACASILHDIGKVDTYDVDDMGTITVLPEEKTIGHISFGMNLVLNGAYGKHKVSREFVREVAHCIASHHGEVEYGAVVMPQSIEADVLKSADYISARLGTVQAELDKLAIIGSPLKQMKIYGHWYYPTIAMKEYYEKLK